MIKVMMCYYWIQSLLGGHFGVILGMINCTLTAHHLRIRLLENVQHCGLHTVNVKQLQRLHHHGEDCWSDSRKNRVRHQRPPLKKLLLSVVSKLLHGGINDKHEKHGLERIVKQTCRRFTRSGLQLESKFQEDTRPGSICHSPAINHR